MELSWYPAPGKLNLFLHVLAQRADGYHELQTVFRLIDRADRVRHRARARTASSRFCGPFGEDNLCVRAARLLKAAHRHAPGRRHRAGKAPADRRRPGRRLLRRRDRAAGAEPAVAPGPRPRTSSCRSRPKLGADVPFFMFGENAFGEGIGERLTALDLPPAWYLVLTPQVTCFHEGNLCVRVDRGVQSTQNTALFRGAGKRTIWKRRRERPIPRGERAASRGFVADARRRA